jgi:alpha-N-arabinofuranosidase
MGRETFLLPVSWTDDEWPLILPPAERVPLVAKSPDGVVVKPSAEEPLNGTFAWRDEFDGDALSPQWIMLREPSEAWWRLDASGGKLQLTPRPDALSGRGNPSYLARRVQHPRFKASLVVRPPRQPGVSAGLAVFQNEQHYYFLAVLRVGNELRVELEQARGRQPEILEWASAPLAENMELRVEANDGACSFGYVDANGDARTLVADADATMLTTEVAGGFVGATVGPYVRVNE